MAYDWKNIIEQKNNKELYGILTGQTVLSHEAKAYARKELERRNFDFGNVESHKQSWELSRLIKEERDFRNGLHGEHKKHWQLKWLYLMVMIVLLFFAGLYVIIPAPFLITVGSLIIFTASAIYTYNNHVAKWQLKAQMERTERIAYLKGVLEKEQFLVKGNPIRQDMERQHKQDVEKETVIHKVFLIGSAITLLVSLISYLLRVVA